MASLGALVPGYILVSPAQHVVNTRSLGQDARKDLAQFASGMLSALEDRKSVV